MDCISSFQFLAIICQLFGTMIVIVQAVRGQLQIDSNVGISNKGKIVVSNSFAVGIILLLGGLALQAFSVTDMINNLC